MELLDAIKSNDRACLSYLGSFDNEITDRLIGLSEVYIEHKTELGKLKNRVSFLIAECFQNIVRHGGVKDEKRFIPEGHSDFFQINLFDDRVLLSSCNIIKHDHVADLEKKLLEINSLDADGQKKLYQDVLATGGLSDKGGAGLGLIEMARKSGLPLKFLFNTLEGDYDQFFLALEIVGIKEPAVEKVKLGYIHDFYHNLLHNNVILFYKGDFSRDIIVPVIEMLQFNLSDNNSLAGNGKLSLITMIELLQNVSKHGKIIDGNKEGIFVISQDQHIVTVEVGNYVEAGQCVSLEKNLADVKAMNLDAVDALCKKQLMSPDISEAGICGSGLLEIARNCNKNFRYTFQPVSDTEVFFTLTVTI